MNLPDKIETGTKDENCYYKLYLTPTDKAINQLIDYLKEKESEQKNDN